MMSEEKKVALLGRAAKEESQTVVTLKAASDTYQRCGGCNVFIEKLESTCDKMKCLCGYKFCWKCGSVGAKCKCSKGVIRTNKLPS
mmetsp:Transcript_31433/g.50743  ORF Transcript_31433/g.50743 Transcript_31433/m.50743 type:complete len:86 (+) Transcript_31433:918-1175(+)